MTFATIDNRETTNTDMGYIGSFITNIIERITKYRTERKELRNLFSYYAEDAAKLEQAQRDADLVWQGHHCL